MFKLLLIWFSIINNSDGEAREEHLLEIYCCYILSASLRPPYCLLTQTVGGNNLAH